MSLCPNGSEYVWQRGVESLQVQVTAAQSWPLFQERKKSPKRCNKKLAGRNSGARAKSLCKDVRNVHKNFLSVGFLSKFTIKIGAGYFFVTQPFFCWQLAFYRHFPTSGRQNTIKAAPQPLFVNRAYVALYITIILPVGPIPISLFVFDIEAKE